MLAAAVVLGIGGVALAAEPEGPPTLWLIGDSTMQNGSGKGESGLWGWGAPIAAMFDRTNLGVKNCARGGRSSRTFLTEGLWDKVLREMQSGDFVMMQFGHNDGGPLSGPKARASIKGNGDATQEVMREDSDRKEAVHSYGWYLRRYIADTEAKGAIPIVLSPIPRNIWKDGKVARASNDYGKWAAEAAKAGGAFFIDLNEIVARHYEAEGPEKVLAQYFTAKDHTHTNAAGAKLNAECVMTGLRELKDCPLKALLAK
jgi:rhamnogalacturonan acetylesterase